MAYPDRVAATGDPLPLTFIKLIDPPALPENQFNQDTPFFLCGSNSQRSLSPDFVSSNVPTLWAQGYSTVTNVFVGNQILGVSHADYGIRESGAIAGQYSALFEDQGCIDGMYVGIDIAVTPASGVGFEPGSYDATIEMAFQRQVLGDYTGGSHAAESANPDETTSITFEDEFTSIGIYHVIPSLASTTADPEALFVFQILYDGLSTEDDDRYGAFKIGPEGSITRIGLFRSPEGLGAIYAHCKDDTTHYFFREASVFTSCVESAWLTFSYDNYTAKFDDPDLPVLAGDLIQDLDPDFKFRACYGTEQGFLISYAKLNGDTWEPKFILVDKQWTEVRHIVATAGDATATAILSQGTVEDGGDYDAGAISMMADDTYFWMIGGTPDVPLIVETGEASDITDEDLTIRVWSFSLDGHDFYVLRLGSETLVYDLTTDSWSHWASPEMETWRAHIGQNWVGAGATTMAHGYGSDVVAGDDTLGILWMLDPTAGQDDDPTTGDPVSFTRKVTGELALSGRDVLPCGAVTLDLSVGAPIDDSATITLRTSDDHGRSFRSHGAQTIASGNYNAVVEWRGLGLMKAPGRIFEILDNGATVRIGAANIR